MLGTVLLAAAAAAAWLSKRQSLEAVTSVNDASVTLDVPREQGLAATPFTPALGPPVTTEQPAISGAPDVIADPRTVVVLSRPELAAGVKEIALSDRCLDAVTTELRGLGGLTIVADSSVFRIVPASEDMSLPERDRRIALGHGAGHVMRVTTQHGCAATLFDSQTGESVLGAGGVDPQERDEYEFAKSVAHSVHSSLLVESNPRAYEARINLLNAGLSDRDRAEALSQLSREGPGVLDDDVRAAAIELGTKSGDDDVRRAVANVLRSSSDQALIQPLLQVIANDPDRSVRYQAIQSVRKYLDEPGVREALLHAAATDPDSEPERFCCTETVREAAERAAVPDSGFLAWVRGRLLDESLPGRSRLINMMGMSSDGRFVGGFSRIGHDLAPVVLDIAQRDPNPRVRAMAWDVMWAGQAESEFMSTEVVPVLLQDLRTSTNERVRAGAARILFSYTDNADVQEEILRAQSDDSLMVRRAATGAGMPPVSAE